MSRLIPCALGIVVLLTSSFGQPQDSRSQSEREKEEQVKQYGKAFEKVEQNLKVSVTGKSEYRAGEAVDIEIALTHKSPEILGAYVWNKYLQEDLDLRKDGKPVKYRTDQDVTFEGKMRSVDVRERPRAFLPHATIKLRTIDLLDWYKKLEPGSYELTVGHRFWGLGKPIKSNSINFQIVP